MRERAVRAELREGRTGCAVGQRWLQPSLGVGAAVTRRGDAADVAVVVAEPCPSLDLTVRHRGEADLTERPDGGARPSHRRSPHFGARLRRVGALPIQPRADVADQIPQAAPHAYRGRPLAALVPL